MSIAALNWVMGAPSQQIKALTGPTGSARLVLIALANHANDDGWAWPSRDTINAEANLTDRTSGAALRWLVEHGYISIDSQGSPIEFVRKPQYRTNLYRLQFDVERDLGGANDVAQGVQSASSRGCSSRHADEITHTSRTTLEPQREPSSVARLDGERARTPDDLFEAFWQAYPRKVGKTGRNGHGARASFMAALKRDGLDSISAGFKRWRDYWNVERTPLQFVPHPATWLNQARYLDEPGRGGGRDVPGVLAQLAAIEFDESGNMIAAPNSGNVTSVTAIEGTATDA